MYCSLKKEKKDSPPQAVAVVLILHRAKLDRPNLAPTTLNRNTDMNKYTGFIRETNEVYSIFDGDDQGWQEADTIFLGIDGNYTGATPSEEDVALFKEWYSTNPHTEEDVVCDTTGEDHHAI